MSVEKYQISKEVTEYTIIPNKVLQDLIYNPFALGLYCYIFSLPPGWVFHKSHLQEKCGAGIKKLNSILKVLEAHNLIELKQNRDASGKFIIADMHVKNGNDYIIKDLLPQGHFCRTAKTVRTVKRTYKRNNNKINNNIINKREREPARKKRVSLPLDFRSNDATTPKVEAIALKVGLSPQELMDKFRAVMRSSGKTSCDWQAELEVFLLNERPAQVKKAAINDKLTKNNTRNAEIRSTVPFFEPLSQDVINKHEEANYYGRCTVRSGDMRKDQKVQIPRQKVDSTANANHYKRFSETKSIGEMLFSGQNAAPIIAGDQRLGRERL